MARKMNVELPDDVADFVDSTYPSKSPAATVKQILKDAMNSNNYQKGVKEDDKTKK